MRSVILYGLVYSGSLPGDDDYTVIRVNDEDGDAPAYVAVRAEMFHGDIDLALIAANPLPGEVLLNTIPLERKGGES